MEGEEDTQMTEKVECSSTRLGNVYCRFFVQLRVFGQKVNVLTYGRIFADVTYYTFPISILLNSLKPWLYI